ncbi:hypothetical protein [Risungbinella massiliensis]|nr:hypothetical protein [Risungbinella massiliensis]
MSLFKSLFAKKQEEQSCCNIQIEEIQVDEKECCEKEEATTCCSK